MWSMMDFELFPLKKDFWIITTVYISKINGIVQIIRKEIRINTKKSSGMESYIFLSSEAQVQFLDSKFKSSKRKHNADLNRGIPSCIFCWKLLKVYRDLKNWQKYLCKQNSLRTVNNNAWPGSGAHYVFAMFADLPVGGGVLDQTVYLV